MVLAVVWQLHIQNLPLKDRYLYPLKYGRRLGIGPGSVLEWDEDNGQIVVRRVGRYTSEEVHRALFSEPPKTRTLDDMKEGIRQYIKGRYARR